MRAGRLRHRITLQIPSRVQNVIGEWSDSWNDWATIWASVEPNSGKRYFEAMQATSDVQGTVVIRYRTGVLPTMRILYGGRIFKIVTIIQPKENMRELHLLYKEDLD